MTGTATLSVSVSNVNDNAPKFDRLYNPVVLRNMRPGEPLRDGTMIVVDEDGMGTPRVTEQCERAVPRKACELFDFNSCE